VTLKIAGALAAMIPIIILQIEARFKQTDVAWSNFKVFSMCANTPGW